MCGLIDICDALWARCAVDAGEKAYRTLKTMYDDPWYGRQCTAPHTTPGSPRHPCAGVEPLFAVLAPTTVLFHLRRRSCAPLSAQTKESQSRFRSMALRRMGCDLTLVRPRS